VFAGETCICDNALTRGTEHKPRCHVGGTLQMNKQQVKMRKSANSYTTVIAHRLFRLAFDSSHDSLQECSSLRRFTAAT